MFLEERLENELIANLITFLLLKSVKDNPNGYSYGYEMKKYVEKRIKKQFENRQNIPEGTLYPILSKLAEKNLYDCLESFRLDSGKRIRYYRLTDTGDHLLQSWPQKWHDIVGLVNQILSE